MKLSVLVASRKNSKFLAKFLFNFLEKTQLPPEEIEIFVMVSKQDDWNQELIKFVTRFCPIKFCFEDKKLGRSGLHLYYNEMLTETTGDWVIYFCDDHYIVRQGWDEYLMNFVDSCKLDPKRIYQVVPTWDNSGSMNQMLSRGYIDTLGNIGRYGNIDSYNNHVGAQMFKPRVIAAPEPIFHDFTGDPEIMTEKHHEIEGYSPLPIIWGSEEMQGMIAEDAQKLRKAIDNGL